MQEGKDLFAHINKVKAFANQSRSIEVKIKDGDVYVVVLMRLPPSFDNLVTSLESMSTKDVDFQFIIAQLLHEVSKKIKMKVYKTPHCLTKLIRKTKSFAFVVKNLNTL
jgi:hypothetical protein